MKIMAASIKRWIKYLERNDPDGYEELLGAIEALEVAEDAFCQARDMLLQTLVAVGFPERGTKGQSVRENIERIERYMKGKGYVRPKRPRGKPFDMRCPTGPSAMLAAAEPGTEMGMEFEEGELVANEPNYLPNEEVSYEAVDLRENPPAFVTDEACWDRAERAAEHANATDKYAFANWWYHRYCGGR